MIEAKEVFLEYKDGTLALKNVNININKGDMVYITGPSGSGKTSLLKLLMGIEFPTKGSLKVLGQPIIKDNTEGIRRLRRTIGPVFQEFRLISKRTALENVMLSLRFLEYSKGYIKDCAYDALEKVGLKHKACSIVDNLSWGECQRIAIARAIARKPSLILADEPTGNLDRSNSLKILELFKNLKDENTTVIITTHATHLIDVTNEDTLITIQDGNISYKK